MDEAVEFVQRTRAFVQLRWFEEPCRWDNDRIAMRDVRFRAGVRVAAGQSEIGRGAVRDLLSEGAVDVINFDASWGGGPTEWQRVAALAGSYGASMGHHEEGHLAAHLLAAVPHGTYVEAFRPERSNLLAHDFESA